MNDMMIGTGLTMRKALPRHEPAIHRSEFREANNLVKHYFNVCNAALTHGTDGTLAAPARGLLTQLASDVTIAVEIAGTGDDDALKYTTRFIDGQFTPVRGGVHEPQARLTLTRDFLEDVERNARDYIENPQRLDWSWLQNDAG